VGADQPVWLLLVITLVLVGLRAVLVETSPGGRGGRDSRLVTIGLGVTMFALAVAVAMRGGTDLVSLLLNPPVPVPPLGRPPVPIS
jgi:hypothetical protein